MMIWDDAQAVGCIVSARSLLQWSREIGQRSDPVVNVPVHASEHFYVVTKPMEGEIQVSTPSPFRQRLLSRCKEDREPLYL